MRFRLPDPVLDRGHAAPPAGSWSTDADPNRAVLLQVPDLGAFVRVLLPVRLTGGHQVTFGVWLSVQDDDLHRAIEAWWAPTYPELVLEGRLANALPGWGLAGAHAVARVHDEDETPYIDESADPLLTRVLTEAWPHEEVLATLPA